MSNHYEIGTQDTRPWGHWAVTDAGPNFVVKRITVKTGGQLSLQMHHGRHEHWIIVSGRALVTLGDEIFEKTANESIFIPVETRHRIENPYAEELVFIEVQWGQHLDEGDIVRFDDRYGRTG